MKLANLVKSKYFCYFTYALMVINLLGYVSTGSMECVVIFALATFACKSCLSTNMCLCIFGGLFVSNIIFGCSKVKEGFREGLTASDCEAGETFQEAVEEVKAVEAVAASDAVCKAAKALADLDETECGTRGGATWNTDTSACEEDASTDATVETFRNRRNRRKAVREAFSTIHRAVRSY
tara:strand:- start:126 stop:665 length:540 start_codon:yes stop_codon:yes gene_type:complete